MKHIIYVLITLCSLVNWSAALTPADDASSRIDSGLSGIIATLNSTAVEFAACVRATDPLAAQLVASSRMESTDSAAVACEAAVSQQLRPAGQRSCALLPCGCAVTQPGLDPGGGPSPGSCASTAPPRSILLLFLIVLSLSNLPGAIFSYFPIPRTRHDGYVPGFLFARTA